MKKLLVIDDEPSLRLLVRAVMEGEGWRVLEAESGASAVRMCTENPDLADVVLLDMRMPGLDGQATLAALHAIRRDLPVVMLTAFGTVGSAVEAMKAGAFDYITKPADNNELVAVLEKAHNYAHLLNENTRLRRELDRELEKEAMDRGFAGKSKAMRRIMDFVRQAAPSEATVLITGESGTGKELVADALHKLSGRAEHPFIKVNCAALPGQLLESELFGYEKGAFTGAVKNKPGRFMLAAGGSIFLDEIGELPLDIQAKLLRVLQEREIDPLGSVKSVPVDVRIICATNRDLRQEARQRRFREDLYFRLNVLEVRVPPLRERLEDLPLLVNSLLARLSRKNRLEARRIAPSFLDALAGYSWPGNVRELENILERALILSRSDILDTETLPDYIFHRDFHPAADAPEPWRHQERAVPDGEDQGKYIPGREEESPPEAEGAAGASPLEQAEYETLLRTLRRCGGHRERTAAALGVSRRTLQYKLKKFGLVRYST